MRCLISGPLGLDAGTFADIYRVLIIYTGIKSEKGDLYIWGIRLRVIKAVL